LAEDWRWPQWKFLFIFHFPDNSDRINGDTCNKHKEGCIEDEMKKKQTKKQENDVVYYCLLQTLYSRAGSHAVVCTFARPMQSPTSTQRRNATEVE
jgi:hypothetical protein